jgi:hypothetical protein
VILLLTRRRASVFHRVGAATRFAFRGYLQEVQCFHSVSSYVTTTSLTALVVWATIYQVERCICRQGWYYVPT